MRKKIINTVKSYRKWIKSPKRLYDPLLTRVSHPASEEGDE